MDHFLSFGVFSPPGVHSDLHWTRHTDTSEFSTGEVSYQMISASVLCVCGSGSLPPGRAAQLTTAPPSLSLSPASSPPNSAHSSALTAAQQLRFSRCSNTPLRRLLVGFRRYRFGSPHTPTAHRDFDRFFFLFFFFFELFFRCMDGFGE